MQYLVKEQSCEETKDNPNRFNIIPDNKPNKQYTRELNKTFNSIFEDKPFSSKDEIFSKLHVVSKRPADLTSIVDIKFMYAPWRKILK